MHQSDPWEKHLPQNSDAQEPTDALKEEAQASQDQADSPDSDLLAELLGNLMGKLPHQYAERASNDLPQNSKFVQHVSSETITREAKMRNLLMQDSLNMWTASSSKSHAKAECPTAVKERSTK